MTVYILAGAFIHAENAARQYGFAPGSWRFVVTDRDVAGFDLLTDVIVRDATFTAGNLPAYPHIIARLCARGFQWSDA